MSEKPLEENETPAFVSLVLWGLEVKQRENIGEYDFLWVCRFNLHFYQCFRGCGDLSRCCVGVFLRLGSLAYGSYFFLRLGCCISGLLQASSSSYSRWSATISIAHPNGLRWFDRCTHDLMNVPTEHVDNQWIHALPALTKCLWMSPWRLFTGLLISGAYFLPVMQNPESKWETAFQTEFAFTISSGI